MRKDIRWHSPSMVFMLLVAAASLAYGVFSSNIYFLFLGIAFVVAIVLGVRNTKLNIDGASEAKD